MEGPWQPLCAQSARPLLQVEDDEEQKDAGLKEDATCRTRVGILEDQSSSCWPPDADKVASGDQAAHLLVSNHWQR